MHFNTYILLWPITIYVIISVKYRKKRIAKIYANHFLIHTILQQQGTSYNPAYMCISNFSEFTQNYNEQVGTVLVTYGYPLADPGEKVEGWVVWDPHF